MNKPTFLLVEDDPQAAILLKRIFKKKARDITITVASDGAEALQYLTVNSGGGAAITGVARAGVARFGFAEGSRLGSTEEGCGLIRAPQLCPSSS